MVNPSIPGHIQVLIKQGETFGVTLDEMVNCEFFPECRGLTEFARGLVYEGSMIEWWARSLNEDVRRLGQTMASSPTGEISL